MNLKRKALFAALPAVLALCACSQNGGDTSSSPSESEAPASSSPSSSQGQQSQPDGALPKPSAKQVSFSFWTTFGQSNGEAVQAKADEFASIVEKNEGVKLDIKIEYQGGYTDILGKISKGFAVGEIPTMAIAYPDHVANYLNVQGGSLVYNLDSYMNDPVIGFGKQEYLGDSNKGQIYDADDFVESFLDEGKHYAKEGTYSLPLMKSSEVMFYNKQAVANAFKIYRPDVLSDDDRENFISHMSWDEMMELSKVALENKDKVLSTLETPIWYDSDANFIISKMYQESIPYSSVDSNGTGHIDFETGEARTKLESWLTKTKKEYDDGLIMTKGVKNTYGSDAFKNGQVLFEVGSSGGTGYNNPEGSAFEVGVARVPANNNNPLYVTQGPTMTFLRSSKISAEENDAKMYYAWQFAKYLTNPEVNDYLCVYGSEGYLPVRHSGYETDSFLEFMDGGEIYADSAKVLINDIDGNYLNTDVFVGSAELRNGMGGALTQVLTGTKGVTQALSDAISTAKTFFK